MKQVFALACMMMVGPSTVYAAASSCELRSIDFEGSTFVVGSYQITLGEPDSPERPQAWIGPMTVTKDGKTCTVDPNVSIMQRPFATDGRRGIFVSTYSGSHFGLAAIDAQTCKVLWSLDDFPAPAVVDAGSVSMAGRALRLDDHCRLKKR